MHESRVRSPRSGRRSDLSVAMAPLLRCMHVLGLQHTPGSWRSRYFSLGIILLLTFNFVRKIDLYRKDTDFGPNIFFKIMLTMWTFQFVINSIVCYHFSKCFASFVCDWDSIVSEKDIPFYLIRRVSIGLAIFCFFSIALCEVVVGVWFFMKHEESLPDVTSFLHADEKPPLHAKLINMVILIFETAACVYPLSLFIIMTLIMYLAYNKLANDLQQEVTAQSKPLAAIIERHRLRHFRVTYLVVALDTRFRWYILATYLTNLPMACFIIFNLFFYWSELEVTVMKLSTALSLPYVLLDLASVIMLSAMVDEAVMYTGFYLYALLVQIGLSRLR